jgi:prolyl-tRNA editing enzyme YbaK/EbsC (Cys-tRNA(Pro) deacylase)
VSDTPTEARVLAALDAMGVAYERIACDPSLADTAAFCAHYGYDLAISANAIVVATKKEPRSFAVCLVLATTRLDVNRAVRRELGGAKVSFATPEEMRAATGMEVGGVTPFGLQPGFPLLVDAAVAACDRVIVGTGGRTSKVLVPSAALVALPGARVVEGLANPVAAAS